MLVAARQFGELRLRCAHPGGALYLLVNSSQFVRMISPDG